MHYHHLNPYISCTSVVGSDMCPQSPVKPRHGLHMNTANHYQTNSLKNEQNVKNDNDMKQTVNVKRATQTSILRMYYIPSVAPLKPISICFYPVLLTLMDCFTMTVANECQINLFASSVGLFK